MQEHGQVVRLVTAQWTMYRDPIGGAYGGHVLVNGRVQEGSMQWPADPSNAFLTILLRDSDGTTRAATWDQVPVNCRPGLDTLELHDDRQVPIAPIPPEPPWPPPLRLDNVTCRALS